MTTCPQPTPPSILRRILAQTGLAARFADYTPEFRLEQFDRGRWWVLDRDIRVGLVTRPEDFAELVNFDPYHPMRDIAFPRLYHAPTQPGDRITLAKWVDSQTTTSGKNELHFSAKSQSVTATFAERWTNGRTAWKKITWRVDPDFGYSLACEDQMLSSQPEAHEYCNFLPRGAADDRAEFARYPYILWQRPSGKIVRWNQNNIGALALGAIDSCDRRRIASGGFIGFFGEKDRNVALELLDSSPGSTATTCPNLFDEHISWVPAEVEQPLRSADGRYLYRSTYHIVSVPPVVGDHLAAQAGLLDLVLNRIDKPLEHQYPLFPTEFPRPPGQPWNLSFCPLVMGKVTDFEDKLDPSASFRGKAFFYFDDTDDPISIVSDCAHSGTRSLRVRVEDESRSVSSHGSTFHVNEGQPYRLSAWIKTDLREGEAVLAAVEFLFSPGTYRLRHLSDPIGGRQNWRCISVVFVPGEKAHGVNVSIDVKGHGTVWVDDVLLEPVKRP